MSNEGTETITTYYGEWVVDWAGRVGVGYPEGDDDDDRRINICGGIVECKGCIPRTVVEALFARVER